MQTENSNTTNNKMNKSKNLILPGILILLVVVTAIAGILIAQRQYRSQEAVSPGSPESRPSAAEETNCTLSFTPEEAPPGDGIATCIDKQAHTTFLAQNSNFNQTNMPYRSPVTRGQQFVYRIIVGPEDAAGASQVAVVDPLPPHVNFVSNAGNTPGLAYDDRTHAVTITLDSVTEEQTIEFMVEVADDAPTTSPLSWFWNTAYVGDVNDSEAGGIDNRDAECSTKLVVVSDSNSSGPRTTPTPTPDAPNPPRR